MKRLRTRTYLLRYWLLPLLVVGFYWLWVECNFGCEWVDNQSTHHASLAGSIIESFIMGLIAASALNLGRWAALSLMPDKKPNARKTGGGKDTPPV